MRRVRFVFQSPDGPPGPALAMHPSEQPRPLASRARRRVLLLGAAGLAGGLASAPLPGRAGAPSPATGSIAAAELKRAAERGELCSATNATGSGLRGEYFSRDPRRSAPLLVRVDPTVDFDASLDWPASLAAQRPGGVRWTGWVKPPIAGRYRFHVGQPGARIVVARTVLAGEGAAADAAIELAAGRFYPITVEVPQLDAISGRLALEWTAPYGARYVVPRALLFVPSETASTSRS